MTIYNTNVKSILSAACMLQMKEVQESCCRFLEKSLNPSNCLGIRAIADTYACRNLLHCANKYILHIFQHVVGTEQFYQLSVNQLVEIISSDELNIRSEEQVFEAVIQWVRFDISVRKQFLPELLEHVRLPLCSPKFLADTVSEDASVMSDEACRDLLEEAKTYHRLQLSTPVRSNIQGPRIRLRDVMKQTEVSYRVRRRDKETLWYLECLDLQKAIPLWQQVAPLSRERRGFSIGFLGGFVYVIGGVDGETYLDSTERFVPIVNQFATDIAPMSVGRAYHKATRLNGFLYVTGGSDGTTTLDVVERYDPQENIWTIVAPMTTRRQGHYVSKLNGCLYAVGGFDGVSVLNTVERFDPRVGKWENVSPMSACRRYLKCGVHHGHLYAMGGEDESGQSLHSVEKYNPTTDQWTAVTPMNERRSEVGGGVVNKKLYAMGGYDDATEHQFDEVFDPKTNVWSTVDKCMKYCYLQR